MSDHQKSRNAALFRSQKQIATLRLYRVIYSVDNSFCGPERNCGIYVAFYTKIRHSQLSLCIFYENA